MTGDSTCLCVQELVEVLAHEGACESAIYPEAVFVQDCFAFSAGMIQQGVCDPSFLLEREFHQNVGILLI